MPDINMQVFEEAQRNQLVTEVDIQTQVTLNDYQVQLSDIANPTQSQDNVVIDRHGEFLPHWNESLDFDTWVKMSMEVSGKRILMLHGNPVLSSTSNGATTFNFFDDFDNLDKWDGYGSYGSVSNSIYSILAAGYIKTKTYTNAENHAIRTRFRHNTASYYPGGFGWMLNTDDMVAVSHYTNDQWGHKTIENSISSVNGPYSDNNNWYIWDLTWTSDESILKYSSTELSLTTNIPTTSLPIRIGKMTTAEGSDIGLYCDWILVRKYTAIEPTWVADGEEQNIGVVFKSFGRAG